MSLLHLYKRSSQSLPKQNAPSKVQQTYARNFHTSNVNLKYFDKILIANRGEIACRVMKSARKLGIKTVAVHSEADSNALHVKYADEAVCVGPPPTSQSYLNVDAIMDAIKKTGAQAVHPGYGFLSENSKFAKRLEDSGITFIGPTSFSMHAMGDKIESKKLASKAKVNVIPGELTDVNDPKEVLRIANAIGYPVMLKASAGGGGKGMRIAWNDQEAIEGFKLAKEEALASFGDDRILIEKFIDNPRHIEIQIMGDKHGNTYYLNERECSIQRRNQKVLEEAPSSFIDPELRKAMGQQAVSLAKAVGYHSAGTVEFLVDSKKHFYFLEMNTRLQVEHPVTEYTTGFDLVEMMIKVAAGEKLTMKQEDIPLKGWAMEARVYAEDPFRNFLPSIGYLNRYKEPSTANGTVRVDGGVEEGGEISIYYDPLISKLVTYGKNRQEAIDAMKTALDTYVIRGVNHNVSFIRSVLEHPKYVKGDISTKFIPQEYPKGFQGHQLSATQLNELIGSAAVMEFVKNARQATISGRLPGAVEPTSSQFVVNVLNQNHEVTVTKRGESYSVVLKDGQEITVETKSPVSALIFEATVNGKPVHLQFMSNIPQGYRLQHVGTQFDVQVMTPLQSQLSGLMPKKQKVDTAKFITSPMPGKVVAVNVKPGDKVLIGEGVITIEAMKMRNVLRAERDGIVKKVYNNVGDSVAVDATLLEFE